MWLADNKGVPLRAWRYGHKGHVDPKDRTTRHIVRMARLSIEGRSELVDVIEPEAGAEAVFARLGVRSE